MHSLCLYVGKGHSGKFAYFSEKVLIVQICQERVLMLIVHIFVKRFFVLIVYLYEENI